MGKITSLKRLSRLPLRLVLVGVLLAASLGSYARAQINNPSDQQSQLTETAQVDYFLKIDGIEGESTDDKHKGEIQLESYSWGQTQPGLIQSTQGRGGGAGGAGKVSVQDFHFTMKVSKATPKIMVACATGQHIKQAILTARKKGEQQQEFLKITLSDVLISSYQTGDSQGSLPMDQISMNFSKVETEYTPQKPDGSNDTPVRGGYDVKANKAF